MNNLILIYYTKYWANQEKKKLRRNIKMKATGIVRRMDDLGRVVIPKEIRKTMRIKEGDSLEIYTDSAEKIIGNPLLAIF